KSRHLLRRSRRPVGESDSRAMCGRFTSGASPESLRERFQVSIPDAYRERYNLAPTQRALIVRRGEASEREAVLAHWGLLPRGAKDDGLRIRLIHAGADTPPEKPPCRSRLARRRCLVVAEGFYEWRTGEDGAREPLRFALRGGEPFGFAGLWTARTDDASGEL